MEAKDTFKNFLYKLVDDALPEEEKKKRKGKKRDDQKDVPTGITKYLRNAVAAED